MQEGAGPATYIEDRLLGRLRRHMEHSGISITRLGREINSEPYLVRDMEWGRSLSTRVVARIEQYLDAHEVE